MIDTTKYGITGFGSAYGDPYQDQMIQNQQAMARPQPYGTSGFKTSVTRKPDGTTSKSQEVKTGEQSMYNPNPQLPAGYSGFQQPQGMTNAQGAWQNMINTGGGMADTTAWMNSFQPQMQYTIQDAINQAMQVGGQRGMLNSSPMTRMQGDIAGRAWAGIAPQMAQMQLDQYNQGANRYMQAAQGLENNAMGQFGLGQNWANNAFNMGNAYQNQQQGMLGTYAQEMARMRGENNPFYNLALQGMNAQNQVAPVQYQPSAMSQMFGMGTNLLGAAGLAGGFGKLF